MNIILYNIYDVYPSRWGCRKLPSVVMWLDGTVSLVKIILRPLIFVLDNYFYYHIDMAVKS